MNRLFFGISLCVFFIGQSVACAQSTPSQPASTIQANANLVVIDVVVTDSRHDPVRNLSKTDFTVLENGHPQAIKNFEEHTASDSAAPLPPMPKLLPGAFTNYTSAPANGALNVLLLDSLNTPMAAQAVVRDQILKYLKELHPGTRMAIFGLNTRLILLQGFTSDPELLRSVLNSKKGLPKGSVMMTDQVNGDSPGAGDPMIDAAEDALGNDPSGPQILANLQQFEAQVQSFQLQLRAHMTLDAFNLLARYLSGLQGRKNLIWFSGSFPINILPDSDLLDTSSSGRATPGNAAVADPFNVVASAADEFRETTEMLARAQVAVYPIDARGLMTAPMLNAQNPGRTFARNPTAFAKADTKFFQQTADEHGTMESMAQATGGEPFANTNGLKEAVQKAVNAGSNYYTMTYTPGNQEWKGEYRKIKVEVARQGLALAYRRGYYADDPRVSSKRGESTPAVNSQSAPYNALRMAMMRGGPDPTEITFVATVRPTTRGPESSAAPGNHPDPKAAGPFQRYTVQFSLDVILAF